MSRSAKSMNVAGMVILAIALMAFAGVFWVVHIARKAMNVPVAYAAWDTGRLLVEYLDLNQGHWPGSCDDLLTVLKSEGGKNRPGILLRGGSGVDKRRDAEQLRGIVLVDWRFDPERGDASSPVTLIDGSPFPMLFTGGDPNEMVQSYLAQHRQIGR